MIELISNFIGYGIVALIILGIVVIIPRWLVMSTEAENDPDHIYTIFNEESGSKGNKLLSAVGCFFPFIELSKESNNVEGLLFVVIVFAVCAWYHSSVYKGYPVLDAKLKITLAILVGGLTIVSFLTRYGFMSAPVFIFILIFSGTAWGAYAIYKRAKLIRLARSSTKDTVNGAA